jgi:shikimate dehydrogenase
MSVALEPILTLADLAHWPRGADDGPAGMVALAVVGHPVAHSLSPVMHNAALAELAKSNAAFSGWRYFKFDIAPEALAAALAAFHARGFRGLNLTVPHKALAMPHLEAVDASAHAAGAANTLVRTDTGWRGCNTDGTGLTAALREDLGVTLRDTPVLLLGAGGAARAAAVACLGSSCAALHVGTRTPAGRRELLAELRAGPAGIRVEDFDLARPPAGLPAQALVINATSLGLDPHDGSPLDLDLIPRPAAVYDMIYRPPQTALLRQAARLGVPHANGLSMLIRQGAASLQIWTGEPAPVNVMRAAARAAN